MKAAVILGLVAFALLCSTNVEAGATQCYFCEFICDDPQVENCPNADTIDYSCWTESVGDRVIAKTCIENTTQNQEICDIINNTGIGECSMCDTDLCNA